MMSASSSRSTRRALGTVLALLSATSFPTIAAGQVVIGVISPRNRAIGIAHEKTIEFAEQKLDREGLRFVYKDDGGDPTRAAAAARELVSEGAIAILGPVNSDCTAAVLAAKLDVPVLSALSTSPDLSRNRDRWFFRLTPADDERIRHFVRSLRKPQNDMMPAPHLVLYEDVTSYGRGLQQALLTAAELSAEATLPWSALIEGGVVDDTNRRAVASGGRFSAAGSERLRAMPASVFVLGGNRDAVAIAEGVDAWFRNNAGAPTPKMFFASDDAELKAGAPVGSLTIGEPTIVGESGSEAPRLRSEFSAETERSEDEFVVAAYEAALYVLPHAIEGAHVGGKTNDGPRVLRERLRETLETGRFPSSEPWRFIKLEGGAIRGAPALPVYRIERRLALWDVRGARPWLAVDAPRSIGFLQGPVAMQVTAHGPVGSPEFRVELVTNGGKTTVESTTEKQDEGWRVSFYPLWPGRYQLETTIPTNPPSAATQVAWQWGGYPAGLVGALVGSFVFLLAGGSPARPRIRFLLGLLTGLLLVAAVFHKAELPDLLPIPLFGESLLVNALWAGFAGGWFGPSLLFLLVARVVPGLLNPPPDAAPKAGTQASDGAPLPSGGSAAHS